MPAKHVNSIGAVGAVIAFCIGAGFATGQEVMQFFVAYGGWGFAGVLISFAIYTLMCRSLMAAGRETSGQNEASIFAFFAGRRIGRIFDWYTLLLLFMIYVVMLAGAGSVFQEYFGLPGFIGRLFLSLIVVLTVAVGFHRLSAVLGALGVCIVLGVLLVGGAGVVSGIDGLTTISEQVVSSVLPASSSWWLSGILYASFMSLPLTAFLAALGRRVGSAEQGRRVAISSSVAFCGSVAVVALALLLNIDTVAGESVPLLTLADELVPVVAAIFSIILIAANYTTAAGLLWSICNRFTSDGSRRMLLLASILAAIAFLVSFLPFVELVNIVYPSSGWVGIAFLLCISAKFIGTRILNARARRSEKIPVIEATQESEGRSEQ